MPDNRIRLTQNISLMPRHMRGLEWLLKEAGEVNKSTIIRGLIEAAMRQRFGPNWLEVIERDEVEAQVESVVSA